MSVQYTLQKEGSAYLNKNQLLLIPDLNLYNIGNGIISNHYVTFVAGQQGGRKQLAWVNKIMNIDKIAAIVDVPSQGRIYSSTLSRCKQYTNRGSI